MEAVELVADTGRLYPGCGEEIRLMSSDGIAPDSVQAELRAAGHGKPLGEGPRIQEMTLNRFGGSPVSN